MVGHGLGGIAMVGFTNDELYWIERSADEQASVAHNIAKFRESRFGASVEYMRLIDLLAGIRKKCEDERKIPKEEKEVVPMDEDED